MNPHFLDKLDAMQAWFHRWRWWTRLLLAIIIVPWFGRFAYVRMTALPAKPNAASTSFGGESQPIEGPTKALLEAIPNTISVSMPAPATAPAGKEWVPTEGIDTSPGATYSIDPYQALAGQWSPQERYHLQQIIKWLETPGAEDGLSKVAALASQPFRLGFADLDVQPLSPFRQACKILCAHARYSMAERHDVQAATRDIRAIFDLCRKLEDNGNLIRHLVSIACRAIAYEELMCWSREFNFAPDDAQRLIAIVDEYRLDLPKQWSVSLQAEGRFFEGMVDSSYTQDSDGNGHYVAFWNPQTKSQKVLLTLNLLSPLVADRQRVVQTCRFARQRGIEAMELPYDQALRRLGYQPGDWQGAAKSVDNPINGPVLLSSTWQIYAGAYRRSIRCAISHSAAMTSLALSVYRTQHGRYPECLSELAPECIKSLPVDPISHKPLCYRLDEHDGYSLYSVAENGTDDGGQIWKDCNGKRELWRAIDAPDWVFPGIRDTPDTEWFLVPATQPTGDGTNASAE